MKLRRYVIVHHRGRKNGQSEEPLTMERRFFLRINAERLADKMTLRSRTEGLWTGDWYDVRP